MDKVLHSSARQDWRTPKVVLDCVRAIAPIGLDPCADPDPARQFAQTNICTPLDGLSRSWVNQGLVFVNPPYGREQALWIRAALVGDSGNPPPGEAVVLIPARPDTQVWHEVIFQRADVILWWRGRLKFDDGAAPAPFPSALIYRGPQVHAFEAAFSGKGAIWIQR